MLTGGRDVPGIGHVKQGEQELSLHSLAQLLVPQHVHQARKRKRHSLIACSKLYPLLHQVRVG